MATEPLGSTEKEDWRASKRCAILLMGALWLIYLIPSVIIIPSAAQRDLSRQFKVGVQDQFVGIDTFSINDSSSIVWQSLSLIHEGNMDFRPDEVPHLLEWRLTSDPEARRFSIPAIDGRLRGMIASGEIRPHDRRHSMLVPAKEEGMYLNTFGFGGSLAAAPAFTGAEAVLGRLDVQPARLEFISIVIGAAMVAISAGLLFLTLEPRIGRKASSVLAIAYGLGTCVVSTSSQGVWQHSATAVFLSAGLYLLANLQRRPNWAMWLGASLAMATLSRPTLGLVAALVGVHLALHQRMVLGRYILGGLPLAIALLAYNFTYLGSPLKFGQTELIDHAMEKTGVAAIWQTPPWLGALGLLFSPSRGLLIFSPFLLASVWGAAKAWRDEDWAWVRPLTLATAGIIFIESNHFDWWGGWSYGYRHLVDLVPMLMVMIGPVITTMMSRWWARGIFYWSIAFSIYVQVIGVTANSVWGWNARLGYVLHEQNGDVAKITPFEAEKEEWIASDGRLAKIVFMNVDQPEYRHRLWSLVDSPIVHGTTHFLESWVSRQAQMLNARRAHSQRVAEAYVHLGNAYKDRADDEMALKCYQWALESDPACELARMARWAAHVKLGHPVQTIIHELTHTLQESPEDVAAHLNLAFAWAERGDLQAAVDAMDEALRLDPDGFLERLRIVEVWMGNRLQRGEVARPSDQSHEDFELFLKLATMYGKAREMEMAGDPAAAVDILQRATHLRPTLVNTRRHLARLLLEDGKRAEALGQMAICERIALEQRTKTSAFRDDQLPGKVP